MANPEHLAILKQGVEVWNNWRKENPTIQPDFIGADLRGADFSLPEVSDLRQSRRLEIVNRSKRYSEKIL
jgi:hypothetical protein